jgi:hypothetical protein
MSDTPRTDELHRYMVRQSELPGWIVGRAYVGMHAHAEQLEHELSELTQRVAELQRFKWNDEQIRIADERAERLARELAERQERCGLHEQNIALLNKMLTDARRELAEAQRTAIYYQEIVKAVFKMTDEMECAGCLALDHDKDDIPGALAQPAHSACASTASSEAVQSTDAGADVGHTPGPWLIVGGTMVYALMENPEPSRGMPARINRFDCNVQGVFCPHDEKRANARLIAAAPDLLSALRDLLKAADHSNCDSTACLNARRALAAASGTLPDSTEAK